MRLGVHIYIYREKKVSIYNFKSHETPFSVNWLMCWWINLIKPIEERHGLRDRK